MIALHSILVNPQPVGMDLTAGLTLGVGLGLFIIAIILAFMGTKQ